MYDEPGFWSRWGGRASGASGALSKLGPVITIAKFWHDLTVQERERWDVDINVLKERLAIVKEGDDRERVVELQSELDERLKQYAEKFGAQTQEQQVSK